MIHREDHRSTVVLRMERGKVNALDLELLTELRRLLADLRPSPARAVVLTGTGAAFSAGVDLLRVVDGGEAYLARFLPALGAALRELFFLPMPVVAALNGHAIAGGCILAAAADRRVMCSGPGRVGVTELLVGVPFPAIGLEVMRFLVGDRRTQDLVLTGKTVTVDEALACGLVDEIVDPLELQARALEIAERLGAIPSGSFGVTKRQLRQPVLLFLEKQAAAIDGLVDQLWKSEQATDAIESYMASVKKRPK